MKVIRQDTKRLELERDRCLEKIKEKSVILMCCLGCYIKSLIFFHQCFYACNPGCLQFEYIIINLTSSVCRVFREADVKSVNVRFFPPQTKALMRCFSLSLLSCRNVNSRLI